MSCLCLEENVENDPCKFALTSRTGGVVETFILHSSSPSVRQTWIHEINQILENQRNFLNGNVCSVTGRVFCLRYTFLFLFSLLLLPAHNDETYFHRLCFRLCPNKPLLCITSFLFKTTPSGKYHCYPIVQMRKLRHRVDHQ